MSTLEGNFHLALAEDLYRDLPQTFTDRLSTYGLVGAKVGIIQRLLSQNPDLRTIEDVITEVKRISELGAPEFDKEITPLYK